MFSFIVAKGDFDMMKKRPGISIIIFMLIFGNTIMIPENANIAFAKTTTLRELKKDKRDADKLLEKYHQGFWVSIYKCKHKVIRWESFKSGLSTSCITYYKLKADGQTLKLICDIEQKSYYDEKASTYKTKYKIKRIGSSKYVKLSKKKFKKLEKKYKVIKQL